MWIWLEGARPLCLNLSSPPPTLHLNFRHFPPFSHHKQGRQIIHTSWFPLVGRDQCTAELCPV